MAEKSLTEQEWKKFSKGRSLKDAALIKAFGELDKAADPAARLEALDEIEKQADALRKANKADKEVTAYLDDVDKALPKERKLAQAEAKKAESESDEGEEEDAPDLLTTKLIPLMRQVRKGDVMKVMMASAGKDSVVLLSRKSIGPPRRKLLTNYLGVTSGVKFFLGECLWEENANTFVMQTEGAGLAKKIKAALLAQTETRYKVRVRGEDGTVDDDGEPAEEQEQGERESEETSAQEQTQTQTPDPASAAFNARLAGLMPRVKEALAAAGPAASDLKLLVSEAGNAARKKDFGQANAQLDKVEQALAAPPPSAEQQSAAFNARLAALLPRVKQAIGDAVPSAAALKAKVAEAGELARGRDYAAANAALDAAEKLITGPPPGAASRVKLQQSRLSWDTQRKSVQAQLQALERELLAAVKAHNEEDNEDVFEDGDVAAGVGRLHALLDKLDERLTDKLDEALNAEGEQRQQFQTQAAALVREYQAFINGDPLLAEIDANGFTPSTIRQDTTRTLAQLASQL